MKNNLFLLPLLFIGISLLSPDPASAQAPVPPLKIGIVGDSTVCLYPDASPRRGWGQMLPDFFSADTKFLNLAEGGRSTKSFPKAKWQQILDFKADYVLIQFGHNDSHAKNLPESTDAATDYKDYLRAYVAEARKAGSIPILVTPPHRRLFKDGHLTSELKPYITAMKEVAAELNVPLVDLYEKSGALFESLGEEASAALTINAALNEDQPLSQDRTHFTPKGATELARMVAESLADLDVRLKASRR